MRDDGTPCDASPGRRGDHHITDVTDIHPERNLAIRRPVQTPQAVRNPHAYLRLHENRIELRGRAALYDNKCIPHGRYIWQWPLRVGFSGRSIEQCTEQEQAATAFTLHNELNCVGTSATCRKAIEILRGDQMVGRPLRSFR